MRVAVTDSRLGECGLRQTRQVPYSLVPYSYSRSYYSYTHLHHTRKTKAERRVGKRRDIERGESKGREEERRR